MTSPRSHNSTLEAAMPSLENIVASVLPKEGVAEAIEDITTQIAFSIAAAANAQNPDLVDELEAQLKMVAEIHKIKLNKNAMRTLITASRVGAAILLGTR